MSKQQFEDSEKTKKKEKSMGHKMLINLFVFRSMWFYIGPKESDTKVTSLLRIPDNGY